MLNKKSLYLIGMPGCGKTTLGKKYAEYSGYKFVDTDEIIIKEQGKTIEKIYEEVKEMGFRALENDLIKRFADMKETVICTGGGLPCFLGNIDIMNQQGVTVFMDVSAEEIWRRVKDTNYSGRPIYQNKTPEQVKEIITQKSIERRVFYSKAHITIKKDSIQLEDLLEAIGKFNG
jgi:shikimate kinase